MVRLGSSLPASVNRLRARVARWRAGRVPGSPMPAGLWSAAVSLAREHGVFRIARAVDLDYGSLQRRVVTSGEAAGGGAAFVPLAASALLSAAAPLAAEVVVESAAGTKLVVRLYGGSGGEAVEVAALVAAVCAERR